MPRPTSKAQLLEQTRERYTALQAELEKLTDDQMVDPGILGDWSIKDILAHLLEWQRMVLSWYQAGKRGETPTTPSEKYTWREIPALNHEIYLNYRDAPLDEIVRDFKASHQRMLSEIEAMSNDELFTPKVYKWTNSTTLGSYLTSATCSHYNWARKEIRRGLKAKRQQSEPR